MDADTDEEGLAREGGDLGEDKQFIRRGGDDMVDAVDGRCMERARRRGREGQKRRLQRTGGVPQKGQERVNRRR